jgi:hypothetical protein
LIPFGLQPFRQEPQHRRIVIDEEDFDSFSRHRGTREWGLVHLGYKAQSVGSEKLTLWFKAFRGN